MKARLLKVLKASALLGLIALLIVLFSYKTGWGIPCLFYQITHLQCPACGTWRMLMALLRLDFAAAFAYNAAMLPALPILLYLLIAAVQRYIRTGTASQSRLETVASVCLIAYFIAFGLLRNIL